MIKQPLKPRTSVERKCPCGTTFFVQPNQLRSGRGKFCGIVCKSKGIFSDEVRRKMSANSARKGTEPWNKGMVSVPIKVKVEGRRKYAKAWLKNNPGKAYSYTLARRMRKKGVGGTFTIEEWKTMKAEYSYTCPCCHRKEPEIKLHIDHIIPIIRGGKHEKDNIQPLCQGCNSRKHTKTIRYSLC